MGDQIRENSREFAAVKTLESVFQTYHYLPFSHNDATFVPHNSQFTIHYSPLYALCSMLTAHYSPLYALCPMLTAHNSPCSLHNRAPQPHQFRLRHLGIITRCNQTVVGIFETFLRFTQLDKCSSAKPVRLLGNRHIFPGQQDV